MERPLQTISLVPFTLAARIASALMPCATCVPTHGSGNVRVAARIRRSVADRPITRCLRRRAFQPAHVENRLRRLEQHIARHADRLHEVLRRKRPVATSPGCCVRSPFVAHCAMIARAKWYGLPSVFSCPNSSPRRCRRIAESATNPALSASWPRVSAIGADHLASGRPWPSRTGGAAGALVMAMAVPGAALVRGGCPRCA